MGCPEAGDKICEGVSILPLTSFKIVSIVTLGVTADVSSMSDGVEEHAGVKLCEAEHNEAKEDIGLFKDFEDEIISDSPTKSFWNLPLLKSRSFSMVLWENISCPQPP